MRSHRISTDVKRLLIGAGTGILCFLIGTLIIAFILLKNDLSFSSIKYICFALTTISAVAAGFAAKRKNKQKGIVCGLLASIPVLLTEFVVLLLLNHLQISEEALLLIPAGLLPGMIGGIISSNLR